MRRPAPRLEGVEVEIATKHRRPDSSVWLNQFRVCEKLARTDLSSVFRVEEENVETGEIESFCCKRYRKLQLLRRRDYHSGPSGVAFRTKMDDVNEEARILAQLNHPNCLKLRTILDSNPDSPEGKIYFVTNFVACGALMVLKPVRDDLSSQRSSFDRDGMQRTGAPEPVRESFFPQLAGQTTFTEAQAKCFIKDAASGIVYLHETLGICHRDVKVDNLFLGSDGSVCVGDFGCAEKMDAKGRVRHTKGTYMFMAPECLRPQDETKPYEGHDGRAADAWAIGICTFVMVFGFVPFKARSIESLFEAVGEGTVVIPDDPPVSPELCDFFKKVLQPEWEERISVPQILAMPQSLRVRCAKQEHPWVASAKHSDAAAYAKAVLNQQKASV